VGVVLSRLTVWTAALLMVTAGHGMVCAESDVVIERGMRLDDALKRLQDAGLGIVFSSELVAAGMIVRDAPPLDDLRTAAETILRSHGLAVEEGPGGFLVVVRGSPAPATVEGVALTTNGRPPELPVFVSVQGGKERAAVDEDGRFELEVRSYGTVSLQVAGPFHDPATVTLDLRPGERHRLQVELSPSTVFLREIVVTPSHYRLDDEVGFTVQPLTRDQIKRMPHFADDLYRAVRRLPGATGGDYSARVNIRGGVTDEMLVLLDGMELHDPFHLNGFQDLFSTVDSETVGRVDLLTGGFPATFGDRLSGVMDIKTRTPQAKIAGGLDIGSLNGRVSSEGVLDDDRGTWLVSARGWYPDVVVDLAGQVTDRIRTDFYDAFVKVTRRVSSRTVVGAHALGSFDDLGYETADAESFENAHADDASLHVWLSAMTDWSARLRSTFLVSHGRLRQDREGATFDVEDGELTVDDVRTFSATGLKTDWSFDLDGRHLLRWGGGFQIQRAEYRYRRVGDPSGTAAHGGGAVTTDLEPDGYVLSAFATDRFRLSPTVVVEAGVRWDHQSWMGEHQLSPRLNLRWRIAPLSNLRFAWGRFHQSQRLNELQVEDGVTAFSTAQQSDHWLIGYEHVFGNGLELRTELYRKDQGRVRSRFENQFNPLELFPEAGVDRILVAPSRATSEGVEVLLRRDSADGLSWWLNLSASRAEDRVDGVWTPRSWDQPFAAAVGVDFDLPRSWTLSMSGTYRSGWPTTRVTGEVVGWEGDEPVVELSPGPRNEDRYGDYFRIDGRATRTWSRNPGEFALVLEILNVTNHRNECCTEGFTWTVADDGSVEVTPEIRRWAPVVPSVTARWRW
jgi:outer membrane cobalamin receptor